MLRGVRRSAAAVVGLVIALASRAVIAALPPGGWPQGRHDGSLSGQSQEFGLTSARTRWIAPNGAPLSGEPVVLGCQILVASENGVVSSFNARNGSREWSWSPAYAVPVVGVSSSLALDDADRAHVGLPADPLIGRAWQAIAWLNVALQAYAVDNSAYPPGPDLASALTPRYISGLPPNPITGVAMIESETPSPGDYRYAQDGTGQGYYLGVWSTDAGLLGVGAPCTSSGGGDEGLAPTWPRSARVGGAPTSLRASNGALLWRDEAVAAAVAVQGAGVLPVVRGPAHGGVGGAPGRSRPARGAGAAMGALAPIRAEVRAGE